MRVLLIGADGQLGTDLVKTSPGLDLIPATFPDIDITNTSNLNGWLDRTRPDRVINTAAFTRTEDCEKDPPLAHRVNGEAPGVLARLCAAKSIVLIHYGTDFVFDGRKDGPYLESDAPHPISVYGESKWRGDQAVLAASPGHWVIRSAGLFGVAGALGKGGNFVEAILKKARAGEAPAVVNDIRTSPTYTLDLARRTWEMLAKRAPGGLYHVVNAGACSWFEFAQAILNETGSAIQARPIAAKDWPGTMKRAPNTALASQRMSKLGLEALRPWAEALRDYLIEKGHLKA